MQDGAMVLNWLRSRLVIERLRNLGLTFDAVVRHCVLQKTFNATVVAKKTKLHILRILCFQFKMFQVIKR